MPDIRIPVLRDFEKAIKIYYSLYELGTNDIRSLFGDSIGAERARGEGGRTSKGDSRSSNDDGLHVERDV